MHILETSCNQILSNVAWLKGNQNCSIILATTVGAKFCFGFNHNITWLTTYITNLKPRENPVRSLWLHLTQKSFKVIKLRSTYVRGFMKILNRQADGWCGQAIELTWACYFMEKIGWYVKGNRAKLCLQTVNLPTVPPLIKPLYLSDFKVKHN